MEGTGGWRVQVGGGYRWVECTGGWSAQVGGVQLAQSVIYSLEPNNKIPCSAFGQISLFVI